jgi:hypothetical protein
LANAFAAKMTFNIPNKGSGSTDAESDIEAKTNNREFGRELTNGGTIMACVSL